MNVCILTEQRLTISIIIYTADNKSYLFSLMIYNTATWDKKLRLSGKLVNMSKKLVLSLGPLKLVMFFFQIITVTL